MKYILIIEGHGGGSQLTCELPGGSVNFWWDRSRNANVASFSSKEEWINAQRAIAAARNIRWKVIADFYEEAAAPVVEAKKPLVPLVEIPEFREAIAEAKAEEVPADSPAAEGLSEEAFEARVLELEQLNQSELVDRVKEMKIPGRSAFTTKEKLARAIAEREREDGQDSQ